MPGDEEGTMAGDPSLYRREPGSIRPHGAQIRAVWQWTAELRRRRDNAPALEGAYRALEWAIGISNTPPVTGRRYLHPGMMVDVAFTHPHETDVHKPVSRPGLAEEARVAQIHTGDPDDAVAHYCTGAYGVLAWWMGAAELPEQLIPDQAEFRVKRQRTSAAA